MMFLEDMTLFSARRARARTGGVAVGLLALSVGRVRDLAKAHVALENIVIQRRHAGTIPFAATAMRSPGRMTCCAFLALFCSLLSPSLAQTNVAAPKPLGTRRVQNGTEFMAVLNSLSGAVEIVIELGAGQLINVSEAPARLPSGTLTGATSITIRGPPEQPALLDLGWLFGATVGGGRGRGAPGVQRAEIGADASMRQGCRAPRHI